MSAVGGFPSSIAATVSVIHSASARVFVIAGARNEHPKLDKWFVARGRKTHKAGRPASRRRK